jgi:hypothetical protein
MVQPFEVLTAATFSIAETYCNGGWLLVPAWLLLWAFGLLLVVPGTALLVLMAAGLAQRGQVAWTVALLYGVLNVFLGAIGSLASSWPTVWKVGAGLWFCTGLGIIGLLMTRSATAAVWQRAPGSSTAGSLPLQPAIAATAALAVVCGALLRLYGPMVTSGMPLVATRPMLLMRPEAALVVPGAKAGFFQVYPGTFCQPDGLTSQKVATTAGSGSTIAWYRQRLAHLGWALAPVTDPHNQVVLGRAGQYWFHRGSREWFGLILYEPRTDWHFWDGSHDYVPPAGWQTAFETQYWIERPDRLLPPYNGNL